MSRLVPALPVFLLVMACGLVAAFLPLPGFARVLLILASALIATGCIQTLATQTPAARTPGGTGATPPSPMSGDRSGEISSQLRHDLRGILAAAMLSADQLTLSTDENTRTRAGQILDALDRLTERLKTAGK